MSSNIKYSKYSSIDIRLSPAQRVSLTVLAAKKGLKVADIIRSVMDRLDSRYANLEIDEVKSDVA